jgi:hypothetical protein
MESLRNNPILQHKLAVATRLAENGNPGDTHFVQVSACPLSSVTLTTGQLRNGSTTEHEVHMHMKGPPAVFPDYPRTMQVAKENGYKLYKQNLRRRSRSSPSVHYSPVSFRQYSEMFHNICQHIDIAVRDNHGVKCFVDGDVDNNVLTNIFYLHACDILNLLKCDYKHEPLPTVYLDTPLLESIPENTKNILVHSMLTEYELKFLIEEIDYFYFCYAFHGNFSYLPIRTQVPNDCSVFVQSKFFTNNDDFIAHQRGKLSELNDNQENVITRVVYRSV